MKQTSSNLILIINDGVSKGLSLASSVVASVPSVAFIELRSLRCVRSVRCVGWKPRLRLCFRICPFVTKKTQQFVNER